MSGIESLIADFHERQLPTVRPRLAHLPATSNLARVIIGMRRSGKTYLMFQEMQRLVANGVDKRSLLYLNYEDDRLQPYGREVLDATLETFFRMNPAARTEGAYLFLDEIQAVEGWSRFARRVLDTENVQLYVSGSSAKMLSTEVATEFRGRGVSVELLPLSFEETLLFSGAEVPHGGFGARVRSELDARFADYLRVGGFPGVQGLEELDRIQILQDYVQLVLLRDVIERHGVRSVNAARYFALSLLQSVGSPASVVRLARDLKSRQVPVGKDTLYELLDHFVDAFLVFTVPVYSRSLRVREVNPRKVYAIDPGLAFAIAPAGTSNVGARLENAVYLELRRRRRGNRDGHISYYLTEAKHEVDFIVGDAELGTASALYQVCADVSQPGTRERELRALTEAMRETGLAEATLLTMHEQQEIVVPNGVVHVRPTWQWMLARGEG